MKKYDIVEQIYSNAISGCMIVPNNINELNLIAYELYNIPVLDNNQIIILGKIIEICNIFYNRTDLTVLPIEDGFYDLLLEKYKQYNPNFQVGSAIVDFANIKSNDIITESTNKVRNPLVFYETVKRDEIHQSMHDSIMRTGMNILNIHDYARSPITFDGSHISKRTHNTMHNHPDLVGTLDKVKFVTNQDAIDAGAFDDPNVKILERDFFQDHINKGIISRNQEIGIVAELKYDGISVEADCNLVVQSARTRGDTGIGVASDITPILKDYVFKNAKCMIGEEPVGVKFEAIITKTNLEAFNRARGRSYVNCRSAIVGLFGLSDAYKYRDFITLVPLAVDRNQIPVVNRLEEIEFMNRVFSNNGEPLRYTYFKGTVPEVLYMIKAFTDEAKIAKDYLNFMYDGIVISYFDENIRNKLGRKNFINKYSVAVKFDPLDKQTIFRGYTYEVGQHGNITPMIHYDPVEFVGTIHDKSTGSSYKRFHKLGLRYGDIIGVKYVNDVMPYVYKLECESNRNNTNPVIPFIETCPVCGTPLVVLESGNTAICPNISCSGRYISRMTNMFSKLNIKGFAQATFESLDGYDHLYKLYGSECTEEFYIEKLGVADGQGFYMALNQLRNNPIDDYVIMGALGFTSLARKKWKSILQSIRLKDLQSLYTSCGTLDEFRMTLYNIIPNIGDATCNTIVTEWKDYIKDISFILCNFKIIDSFGSNINYKKQIRFTGFRNQQLSQQLITAGYDADDSASITKKTDILLVPYEGFMSSKVSKAMKNLNTKIVPVQEFVNNMDSYLS